MILGVAAASLIAGRIAPKAIVDVTRPNDVSIHVGPALPVPVVFGAHNGWPMLLLVWALAGFIGVVGWQFARSVSDIGKHAVWLLVAGQFVLGLALSFFPGTFSADPYNYVILGRLFGVHGINPYLLFSRIDTAGDPILARCMAFYGNPSPSDDYGPLWTLLVGGVARLEVHASLWAQVWTHRLIAVAAGVVTSLGLMRIIAKRDEFGRLKPTAPSSGDDVGRLKPTAPSSGDDVGRLKPTAPSGGDDVGRLKPTAPSSGDEFGRLKPAAPISVAKIGAFAFNPLVAYETAAGGHNDIIMIALAVWAFAIVDEYPLIAGLLLGAAASVKIVALIAVPFLVIQAGRRQPLNGVLALLLSAIVVALCFRPFWQGSATLYGLVGHTGMVAMSPTWILSYPFFGAGLANQPAFPSVPALPIFGQPSWPRLIELALVLAMLSVLAYSAWRYARTGSSAAIWRSISALIWSSPIIHPWYLLWIAPASATQGRWARYAWWFATLGFLRYALDATNRTSAIAPPVWVLMLLTAIMLGVPILIAMTIGRASSTATSPEASAT